MTFIEEIKSKTREKDKALLRTKYGISESTNPLSNLPVDLHWLVTKIMMHTLLICIMLPGIAAHQWKLYTQFSWDRLNTFCEIFLED